MYGGVQDVPLRGTEPGGKRDRGAYFICFYTKGWEAEVLVSVVRKGDAFKEDRRERMGWRNEARKNGSKKEKNRRMYKQKRRTGKQNKTCQESKQNYPWIPIGVGCGCGAGTGGGPIHSFSSVNHGDVIQLRVPVRSRMQKRADSDFLHLCPIALRCPMSSGMKRWTG